jgi:nucleoside-triphosphatase
VNCHALFLQGNTKLGKSTLLTDCLRPYRNDAGGFLVQRMVQDGATRAFCLFALSNGIPPLTVPYNEHAEHIFIEQTKQGWQQYPEVFARAGAALLSPAALAGKKLIVLDEIGGIELLSPEFRAALSRALGGDIPCIGVIKSAVNRAKMEDKLDLEHEYQVQYRRLFEDISGKFRGKIITLTDETRAQVQLELQKFLQVIYGI